MPLLARCLAYKDVCRLKGFSGLPGSALIWRCLPINATSPPEPIAGISYVVSVNVKEQKGTPQPDRRSALLVSCFLSH
jgi:hypothetical protein